MAPVRQRNDVSATWEENVNENADAVDPMDGGVAPARLPFLAWLPHGQNAVSGETGKRKTRRADLYEISEACT